MRRSIGMLVAAATAVGAISVALTAPMTGPRADAPDQSAPQAFTVQASEEGAVGYSTLVEGLARSGSGLGSVDFRDVKLSVARMDAASG